MAQLIFGLRDWKQLGISDRRHRDPVVVLNGPGQGGIFTGMRIGSGIGYITQGRHLEGTDNLIPRRLGEAQLGAIIFSRIAVLAEAVKLAFYCLENPPVAAAGVSIVVVEASSANAGAYGVIIRTNTTTNNFFRHIGSKPFIDAGVSMPEGTWQLSTFRKGPVTLYRA